MLPFGGGAFALALCGGRGGCRFSRACTTKLGARAIITTTNQNKSKPTSPPQVLALPWGRGESIATASDRKTINPGRGGSAIGGAWLVVESTTGGKRIGHSRYKQVADHRTLGCMKRTHHLQAGSGSIIVTLKLLEHLQVKEKIGGGDPEAVHRCGQPRGVGLRQAAGSALVGPKLKLADFKDTEVEHGPEELYLKIGERRGQRALVDTTRIHRNK